MDGPIYSLVPTNHYPEWEWFSPENFVVAIFNNFSYFSECFRSCNIRKSIKSIKNVRIS